MEMIKCSRCSGEMPKLRLTSYGYDFCVTCSDVKPKVGRIRVVGEGDYTATELDVLDQDTARRLQEMENTSRGVRNVPLEILNYDEDEIADDAKALVAVIDKALDDELEVEESEQDLQQVDVDINDLELEDEDEQMPPSKFLTKEDCLRAMNNTRSNRGAARFLRCSFPHYKKYAKLYTNDDGVTLWEAHMNKSGVGIPKFLPNKGKKAPLKELLAGTLSIESFEPAKIKQRLIFELSLIHI